MMTKVVYGFCGGVLRSSIAIGNRPSGDGVVR
jgi:hypothetical protein